MDLKQGDVLFIDLEPAKGTEMKKKRPCIIISNNDYNELLDTVIVAPVSSSNKYQENEKYKISPLFIPIALNQIRGTILLQHVRSIDPVKRSSSKVVGRVDSETLKTIKNIVKEFF